MPEMSGWQLLATRLETADRPSAGVGDRASRRERKPRGNSRTSWLPLHCACPPWKGAETKLTLNRVDVKRSLARRL